MRVEQKMYACFSVENNQCSHIYFAALSACLFVFAHQNARRHITKVVEFQNNFMHTLVSDILFKKNRC